VLSNPTHNVSNIRPADYPIDGEWELEMDFVASKVNQSFTFEQKGNEFVGTHYASFAPRKLRGNIYGEDILIRSSYTGEGVRLNYEFTGKVLGDTMKGKVSMGEYGLATWSARRKHN